MPITLHRIAQTTVNRDAVRHWLDTIGATTYEPPQSNNDDLDPALVIALAAKRCYMSFEPGLNPNVTRVRSDLVEYFDNILKSGHGSVLEHATFTYAIEGVSRVFTAEMNRHRAGWAISEGSMRYIRMTGGTIPYWIPESIQDAPDDSPSLRNRKAMSRVLFQRSFDFAAKQYRELLDLWDMDDTDKDFAYKKKVTSCLRRIIPIGVATGGVWTGNARALRHVLAMRCSPAAEEEICHVFSRIAAELIADFPHLFGDFTLVDGHFTPKYPKV